MAESTVTRENTAEIERMVSLCDLFAQASLRAEDQGHALTANDIFATMDALKAEYDEKTPWLIPLETYKAIQRITSQRPHIRKLRKCHMRKIVARARRERRWHR